MKPGQFQLGHTLKKKSLLMKIMYYYHHDTEDSAFGGTKEFGTHVFKPIKYKYLRYICCT